MGDEGEPIRAQGMMDAPGRDVIAHGVAYGDHQRPPILGGVQGSEKTWLYPPQTRTFELQQVSLYFQQGKLNPGEGAEAAGVGSGNISVLIIMEVQQDLQTPRVCLLIACLEQLPYAAEVG